MLKFFRKIRRKLLAENKFSKYLLYAIGEVILVVVGILIAIQIDFWNTAIKNDKLKAVYTLNLINELVKDTIQLKARIKVNEDQFLTSLDSIRAIIENPTTDVNKISAMGKKFGVSGLRTANVYNDNTFNFLLSTGKIELYDDEVIQKIMELNRLQNVETDVSNGNKEVYFEIYNSYVQQYVNQLEGNASIRNEIWKNVDEVKHASLFINMINLKRYTVLRYLELSKNVLSKTEELIEILQSSENME